MVTRLIFPVAVAVTLAAVVFGLGGHGPVWPVVLIVAGITAMWTAPEDKPNDRRNP